MLNGEQPNVGNQAAAVVADNLQRNAGIRRAARWANLGPRASYARKAKLNERGQRITYEGMTARSCGKRKRNVKAADKFGKERDQLPKPVETVNLDKKIKLNSEPSIQSELPRIPQKKLLREEDGEVEDSRPAKSMKTVFLPTSTTNEKEKSENRPVGNDEHMANGTGVPEMSQLSSPSEELGKGKGHPVRFYNLSTWWWQRKDKSFECDRQQGRIGQKRRLEDVEMEDQQAAKLQRTFSDAEQSTETNVADQGESSRSVDKENVRVDSKMNRRRHSSRKRGETKEERRERKRQERLKDETKEIKTVIKVNGHFNPLGNGPKKPLSTTSAPQQQHEQVLTENGILRPDLCCIIGCHICFGKRS